MPAPMKTTSTTTLRAVTMTCRRLPTRVLLPCTSVRASTTATESHVGCRVGHTLRA